MTFTLDYTWQKGTAGVYSVLIGCMLWFKLKLSSIWGFLMRLDGVDMQNAYLQRGVAGPVCCLSTIQRATIGPQSTQQELAPQVTDESIKIPISIYMFAL